MEVSVLTFWMMKGRTSKHYYKTK